MFELCRLELILGRLRINRRKLTSSVNPVAAIGCHNDKNVDSCDSYFVCQFPESYATTLDIEAPEKICASVRSQVLLLQEHYG